MWVISAENLLQLDSFKPHQELQAAGLLELHDPEHRDARVTFVSHEWSSFDHPDPQNAQLHSLQQMILGIRDGSIQLRHDMNSYFRPAMTRPVSLQELKGIPKGYFWIDFLSIPQVCHCTSAAERRQVQEDMRAAVMSLHTYVAHCSFFVVLAPIQYHTSGRLMSYSSWKSRGWCQFELAVNGLLGSGTKPVLNVDTKTVWHVHYLSFWQLSPCCGDFTKDEDRYFIADALQQVMEHMEDSLRSSNNAHRLHLLQNLRKELLKCRGFEITMPRIRTKDRSSSSGLWPGLHYAAALDDVELVRTLLKADADVNACTQCKDLDFQLQCGQTPLHVWAAFSRDPAVAEALLQRKAEVDALDDDRITPLMIACQMGNEASCRTLLRCSANVNHQDKLCLTPIMLAAASDHARLFCSLLEYGADPLYQWAGVGLLHVVAAHCTDFTSECLQNLLKEGLQLKSQCSIRFWSSPGFVLWCALLCSSEARKEWRLVSGSTPLCTSILRGNVGALRLLLQAKADPKDLGTPDPREYGKRASIPDQVWQRLLEETQGPETEKPPSS